MDEIMIEERKIRATTVKIPKNSGVFIFNDTLVGLGDVEKYVADASFEVCSGIMNRCKQRQNEIYRDMEKAARGDLK